MDAVVVRGIVHDYPAKRKSVARRALNDVSFSVAEGELFGLLGPNGGGKSTLFRILSTSFPPTSGSAAILGRDLIADPASVRPFLGVVFQSPSLDNKLTVRENLIHGGRLYGLSGPSLKSRIDEMLNHYRLTQREGDLCGTLSGGLRRRVELAKSLLHKPKIILLDEPSTGLDPAARQDLWEHLMKLKSEGATILTTTHLMDEGDRCDRVAILDQGKIVALGTPSALKAEIGGDVITIETDDASGLRDEITKKFGVTPQAFGAQLRLERASGHAFIPQLVEAFPGRLRTVSLSRPSLEDAFLHHAGRRFSDSDEASK
ncbi:MAG: ATP-binding cassette domain-containing protein [Elusimicrobia bacterium]|nr:ATP-binding cassette domain-containing protein [Elusimicrobiota bacterium]